MSHLKEWRALQDYSTPSRLLAISIFAHYNQIIFDLQDTKQTRKMLLPLQG